MHMFTSIKSKWLKKNKNKNLAMLLSSNIIFNEALCPYQHFWTCLLLFYRNIMFKKTLKAHLCVHIVYMETGSLDASAQRA